MKDKKILFLEERGKRLSGNAIYRIVTKYAERLGYHDPSSDKIEDHLSPHCLRHFFTTEMRRAGTKREFIQELRGDIRKGAVDIYDHIDLKELRESYLACVSQFGV
jgi:integrase/recombinase XerD